MIYSIKNLEKEYGTKKVLKDISFDIFEGEILSILGKNGAGKTTLVKILSKILQKTSGEILYDGENLEDIKQEYYHDISVMLEGDRNTYWYLTGMENIFYFGRLYHLKDSVIRERAEDLLNLFDLTDAKDQKVTTYSRGMRQKLSLIISLIHNPKILFLDEPTLGLDVLTKNKLIKMLKELVRTRNLTIIITSHELDVVERLSDKVLILQDGYLRYIDQIEKLKKLYSNNIYEITFIGEMLDSIKENFTILSLEKEKNTINLRLESFDEIEILKLTKLLNDHNYPIIKLVRDEISLEDIMIKIWGDTNEYR